MNIACRFCMCYVELPNTGGQGGECHRRPPSVVVITSPIVTSGGSKQHINTVFPPVPASSWCAEFVERPSATKERNAIAEGITQESGETK